MTDFQPGDKVRVTYEGVVSDEQNVDSVPVMLASGGFAQYPKLEHVELIERPVTFPEPTEPGTVVRVEYLGLAMVFVRCSDGRWRSVTRTDDWLEVIAHATSVEILWPKPDDPQLGERQAQVDDALLTIAERNSELQVLREEVADLASLRAKHAQAATVVEAVLALHKREPCNYRESVDVCAHCYSLCHSGTGLNCENPDGAWPCPTVQAINKALGGTS